VGCDGWSRNHDQDIRGVAYHRTYPLFSSCADDGTAHVFHGMVYSDLLQNPLIVPLKILYCHKAVNQRGNAPNTKLLFNKKLCFFSTCRNNYLLCDRFSIGFQRLWPVCMLLDNKLLDDEEC
jgi:hypothetical protein